MGWPREDHGAEACLEALRPQVGSDIEVILVTDGERHGSPSWVELVVVKAGCLVPELWAEGMRHASGAIIALTTTKMVVEDDFVRRTLLLHDGPEAAIGGGIDPGSGMSAVDWAAYFCRYSPYMTPLTTGADHLDVPGDNASYRTEVLRRYRHLYTDGFWEPFVHEAMRSDGHRLAILPDRTVHQAPGLRAGAFCRQRLAHGHQHGRRLSVGKGRTAILAAATRAPLVPPLLTARVVKTVLRKGRHRTVLVLVMPLVMWFHLWWATGELLGRLDAVRRPVPR